MRFENSMCNVAYDILKEVNEKVSFNALWNTVCERLGINEEDKMNLISSLSHTVFHKALNDTFSFTSFKIS